MFMIDWGWSATKIFLPSENPLLNILKILSSNIDFTENYLGEKQLYITV